MTKMQRGAAATLLGLALATAGCGGSERAGGRSDAGDAPDTGAVGGLSPEELRARAEPMSPEQAESLGIAIDTSIHIERPSGDTIPHPGPVGSAPPGTAIPPYPPADSPRDTSR
jgi:hypothetical protein